MRQFIAGALLMALVMWVVAPQAQTTWENVWEFRVEVGGAYYQPRTQTRDPIQVTVDQRESISGEVVFTEQQLEVLSRMMSEQNDRDRQDNELIMQEISRNRELIQMTIDATNQALDMLKVALYWVWINRNLI